MSRVQARWLTDSRISYAQLERSKLRHLSLKPIKSFATILIFNNIPSDFIRSLFTFLLTSSLARRNTSIRCLAGISCLCHIYKINDPFDRPDNLNPNGGVWRTGVLGRVQTQLDRAQLVSSSFSFSIVVVSLPTPWLSEESEHVSTWMSSALSQLESNSPSPMQRRRVGPSQPELVMHKIWASWDCLTGITKFVARPTLPCPCPANTTIAILDEQAHHFHRIHPLKTNCRLSIGLSSKAH